jgi:hypothetical protein
MAEETQIHTGDTIIPLRCPYCGTQNPDIRTQILEVKSLVLQMKFVVFFCGASQIVTRWGERPGYVPAEPDVIREGKQEHNSDFYVGRGEFVLGRRPCGAIWNCVPIQVAMDKGLL